VAVAVLIKLDQMALQEVRVLVEMEKFLLLVARQ